ncbi:MAG: 2,7-dihydroxy-5-methyl-naphthoate 7-O-methyltransferase [Pseudonocardiales bacterium]|nr:2,7-dihydroxy-5-methyl-naphthoate 7-O-methyltransferase [Pseudonocardiales bacterium]
MAVDDSVSIDANARLDELVDLATPLGIRAVVNLRVPDQIAAGVHQLDDLAKACDADPATLARLLRYLVHKGVFVEATPGEFSLTGVGELLCDRSGGGRGAYLDLDSLGARTDLALLGLPHAIRTGEPSYAVVHGRDYWSDLDARPEERAYFDELMRSQQLFTAPEVANLYPWSEVGSVTDVGGGSGHLLAELLATHPHLRGTLVDRPEPVATAAGRFAERGVADRATGVVGNFFEALPAGADVYVVSRALTDWNDKNATAILRRCAEAAGPQGRVLVVEVLPTEPFVPHLSSYDLTMLVSVGGRERGLDDHLAMAAGVGLELSASYTGSRGLTLLEFRRR